MSHILISIVTPSFAQAKFIARTMQSVLNQKYTGFEYIVMDGGSKDGTLPILEAYKDKLTYWESNPDRGQSDAINKGFAKASGEWLCWVNADDILFPDALAEVCRCARENPDVDIITGNVLYIDENDYVTRCVRVPRQNWFFYKYGVGVFNAPAVFFKKELFDKIGGLDVSLHYAMDMDMWHRFRLANARVCHIDKYLGAFRVHSSSKTGVFRGRDANAFENPETTSARERHSPTVSKNTIILLRYLMKIYRIVRLDYLIGRINLFKYSNKTWQEIFGK